MKNDKINVCYITPKFKPYVVGAVISLERLIAGLLNKNVNPFVLTSLINKNSDLVVSDDKIRKHVIRVGSSKNIPFTYKNAKEWYETSFRGLVDKLENITNDIDLIYLNNIAILQFPDLCGRIFELNKPIIAKITATNDFNFIEDVKEIILLEKYSKQLSIHCISHEIKRMSLKLGFLERQLFYCPNPINLEEFPLRQAEDKARLMEYPELINNLVFAYVGRLALPKNIDKIVEIFTKLERKREKAKLLMVGYESHPEIKPLIKKLKRESKNIYWTGKIANKNVSNYLKASDCFIMASKDEGLSNALLEAMATGLCPIVPKNLSGMKDLIEDGVNGILYDLSDIDKLVNRLEKMDQKKAIEMGTRARQSVRELCDIERVATSHSEFYKEKIDLATKIL